MSERSCRRQYATGASYLKFGQARKFLVFVLTSPGTHAIKASDEFEGTAAEPGFPWAAQLLMSPGPSLRRARWSRTLIVPTGVPSILAISVSDFPAQ